MDIETTISEIDTLISNISHELQSQNLQNIPSIIPYIYIQFHFSYIKLFKYPMRNVMLKN